MIVYKNEASAKNAIRRQGLYLMNYEIESHNSSKGTGVVVKFFVHDKNDFDEIIDRGFKAEINTEKAA